MEPLFEAVPDRIMTPRLVLRSARAEDAQALYEAVLESMDALRPYVPWAAHMTPSLAQSEADCRRMQARFLLREDLALLMFERDAQGRELGYVGGTGLHRIDWQVRRFEIGYWCRSSRVGQGFIGEAVEALTRVAFDELKARRVEVRMDDDNERSWRVAERAGFALEGVLRQQCLAPDGEPRDLRVYAKTRA